ncbi:conserved hypothetical protein [Leuconostoc carnosum]|nr:conserved hypothetical protein [Leuconostoc carnosum]SPO34023.1 conserved hypothetical protein [Leuconostoc carnosum]
MAIINETIAEGIKNGGVRYFFAMISPKDYSAIHDTARIA